MAAARSKKPKAKPESVAPVAALAPVVKAFARDRRVAQFKSTSLCVDNKVFAMVVGERFVVKLPAARVQALVDAGKGKPHEVGPGRVMKEWLSLPASGDWIAIAKEARAFVGD